MTVLVSKVRRRAGDIALIRDVALAVASAAVAAVTVIGGTSEMRYRRRTAKPRRSWPAGRYGDLVAFPPTPGSGAYSVIRPATRAEWLAFRAGVIFTLGNDGVPAWDDPAYPSMTKAYAGAAAMGGRYYTVCRPPATDPEPESALSMVPERFTQADTPAPAPGDGSRRVRALDLPELAMDHGGVTLPWLGGGPPEPAGTRGPGCPAWQVDGADGAGTAGTGEA